MDEALVDLRGFEILQKPYTNGLFKEQAPTQRVSYLPGGFTPETVLSGDLTQVEDADGPLEGEFWPQKTRLCLQFCNTAYDTQLLSVQRRVRLTRGEFAIRASEEIKKMLGELPQFPFAFDQVRVLCIDVCSRGTLQPRIFVDPFALAPEQLANLTETLRK